MTEEVPDILTSKQPGIVAFKSIEIFSQIFNVEIRELNIRENERYAGQCNHPLTLTL